MACEKYFESGPRLVAVGIVLVLLVVAGAACVGHGRNRSDEFQSRLIGPSYEGDDYGEYGDYQYTDYEDWESAPPEEATMVEHRERPVVDPGEGRSSGTLFAHYKELHEKLSERQASGYVLIWADARVFSSAQLDEASALGRLAYRPENWRASGGEVVPMRVAGFHGAAVEIETLSTEEAREHCDGRVRSSMSAYQVRMFVPRTEIVPVVAREFEEEFDDGSVAFLPPGTAIRPTEDGLLARLAGGAIEVPVDDRLDHIGLSYRRAGFDEARLAPEPMSGHLSTTSPLRLAGQPVQLQMLPGKAGRPRWVQENPGASGSRIYMGSSCIAAIFVTDDADPIGSDGGPGVGLSSLGPSGGSSDHLYEVRQGAPAYWANGERAGATRSVAKHSQEPERAGSLSCFPWSGPLKICHRPADVQMVDRTEIRDVAGVEEEDSGDWYDDDRSGAVQDGRGMWVIED